MIFASTLTTAFCGKKLFLAREMKDVSGVEFCREFQKERTLDPWLEGKPVTWLCYLESTWKTQRDASLVSWLHGSANLVVYEHRACPLLLKKTSSDPSFTARWVSYMQKGERHPWGWWVLAAGHWQAGCTRLLKASHLCPLQHYF